MLDAGRGHAASTGARRAVSGLHGGAHSPLFLSLRLLQESAMQYSEPEINLALIRLFRWGYDALTSREQKIIDMLSIVC
ncbi:MAG TPA: hypothetical protein DCW87_00700 [Comamonadaceae bacterium]|nr:hypothetical protein [Comamonadaceae bacterium]